MQKIIQETQIFGPIWAYANYIDQEEIFLEAHETYQKRSFRNRYFILSPNGPLRLSVPLEKGKNQKTPIKAVKIAYQEPWASRHIHSIQTAYGSAAFFIHYAEIIFDIILSKHHYLFDYNRNILETICEILGINLKISETQHYHKPTKNLILIDRLLQKDLNPTYPQVFTSKFGFTPGLSILDLLFNKGPESILYLESLNKKMKLNTNE